MKEELIVSLTADIKDLKAELNKATTLIDEFGKRSNNTTGKAGKGFDSLADSVQNLALSFISLQAAQSAVVSTFNTSLKLDAINQSYSAIFNSAEEGTRQFERLKRLSNELGLSILSLSDSYKQFAASSSLSVNETNRIFDSVAKSGAILKLSEEQVSRALTAMAQMMSKGTVASEELKGQLGEALPGAYKLAAKAMGVTTQELGKMLDNGQIMATELLPKLATELENTFGSKVQGNVKGLQSEWNKFKNNFTLLVESSKIGDAFDFVLNRINTRLKLTAYALKSTQEQISEKLQFEIDSTKTETELNTLILKFTAIQKTLTKGTSEWAAYTYAIIEAGKKIKDFSGKIETKPQPIRIVGGERLDMMQGAKEQMQIAQDLFNLYKESPKSLKLLGEEYVSNPFFRDLINGDLKKQTKETQEAFQKFLNTKRDDVSGGALPIDKEIEMANEQAKALVNTLGSGLTSAFDAAMTNGTNFFQELGVAILNMIKKLLAAIAVASILSAILGGFGVAASAVGKGTSLFGNILSGLTGGLLGGGGGATGQRVATSVNTSSNSGTVAFEIRGDKLYGVLQNYQGRLDRLT